MLDKENTQNCIEQYKSLMRISFKLVHRFSEFWKDIIAEYGLNQTEFLILGVVADCPGLSQQEIVNLVGVDKSIVSRNLKRLEKRNIVERSLNTEYHHGYFCYATELGLTIYNQIHEKGNPLIEKRFLLADSKDIERVKETLMTIFEHIY